MENGTLTCTYMSLQMLRPLECATAMGADAQTASTVGRPASLVGRRLLVVPKHDVGSELEEGEQLLQRCKLERARIRVSSERISGKGEADSG